MQPSEDVSPINRSLTADNFITPDVANKGKQKAKKGLSAAESPHSEEMLREILCARTPMPCSQCVAAILLDAIANWQPIRVDPSSCTMGKLRSRTKGGEKPIT